MTEDDAVVDGWTKLLADEDWPLKSKRKALEGVARIERSRGKEALANRLLALVNETTAN